MRVFWDTNVLAAAFGSHGLCARLFERMLEAHQVVLSQQVLDELPRALTRFRVEAAAIEKVVGFVSRQAQLVPTAPTLVPWPVRDMDDAWILATAVAAGVDALVTGDRDLLDVAAGAPVAILSPRELWTRLDALDQPRDR